MTELDESIVQIKLKEYQDENGSISQKQFIHILKLRINEVNDERQELLDEIDIHQWLCLEIKHKHICSIYLKTDRKNMLLNKDKLISRLESQVKPSIFQKLFNKIIN